MTTTAPFLGVVSGPPSGPGPAAVTWSLSERAKFPGGKPTAARIAEYFAPAVRGGKKLNMMEGNWCAAGACFAAMKVVGTEDLEKAGLPHAYRVSGKELEDDAIKHGAWLPRADVLKGSRPNVGDLAVYNRGDPQDWTRHVARVVELKENGYTSIDANGTGAAWSVGDKLWTADSLRGFIRYPAGVPGISSTGGILAGLAIAGAAGLLLWGTLRVGRGLGSNPTGPVAAGVELSSLSGRVLFLQRPDGVWELPGGRLEHGETPLDGARRELAEETGITKFKLCSRERSRLTSPSYALFWGVVREEVKPRLSHEHRAFKWAHPRNPPTPLRRELREVYP